jgi:uncharacterized protein
MKCKVNQLLHTAGWNVLLCALILFFQSLFYFNFETLEHQTTLLTATFILLDGISHFGLLLLIIATCSYIPLQLVFRNSSIPLYVLVTACIIFNIYILLDIKVYEIYRFHINAFVIEMITGAGFSQIFVIDTATIIKCLSIVLVVAIVHVGIFYASKTLVNRNKAIKWGKISIGFLVFLISANGIHAWAAATQYTGVLKSALCYPLHFPLTMNSGLAKMGITASSDSASFDAQTKSGALLNYPQHLLACKPSSQKPNILYIVLDSWNYRSFTPEGCPNITAFSKKSSVFTNHFSGSNGTRGGIFSLFYAIPPLYWDDFEISKTPPVFITELQKQKYDIWSITSATIANPPFNRTVFATVPNVPLCVEDGDALTRDTRVSDTFIRTLAQNRNSKNPFFAFLFFDLPHAISLPQNVKKRFTPAWETANYLALNNNTDPTPFYNLYRSCVYNDDILIGRVIKALTESGKLSNTIVVITGDHGQEFNENRKNYWGHNGNFSRAQIGTPLIVYIPSQKPKVYHHMTTHFDIAPTILKRALNVTNPISDYSLGYDLFNPQKREWHLVGTNINFAVIKDGIIATRNFDGSLSLTDSCLNEVDKSKVPLKPFLDIIKHANVFYKGEK